MEYYVTVKVSCPECQGTGQISKLPLGPRPALGTGTCFPCDGTGELRVDAPFTDAFASALDSHLHATLERDEKKC